MNTDSSSFVSVPTSFISLRQVIIAAIAVLNFISSISCETFLTVLFILDSSFFVVPVPSAISDRDATLSRKRLQPLTPLSFHGAEAE